MKKLMFVIVLTIAVVGVVSFAYSRCGMCAEEDTVAMVKDAACTNPDCTVENLCDSCKAKALSAACSNPDCTAENLCDKCKAAMNGSEEAAE